MHLVGLGVFFSMIYWVMTGKSDSGLGLFVDGGSFVISILCPLALLVTCFGPRDVVAAFHTLCYDGKDQKSISVFRMGAGFAFGCGFLGVVMGLCIMLSSLNELAQVGPALAMALLTQFYGVMLAMLCYTAAAVISRRCENDAALAETSQRSMTGTISGSAIALGSVLIAFLGLFASAQLT